MGYASRFGALMALGDLCVGFATLNSEWLSRGVAITAIVIAIVSIALLPMNLPIVALFAVIVMGVGVLVRTRKANQQ